MNYPLHLTLTTLLLTLPHPTNSNPCPPSHTGRVPTANCEGYADCTNGVLTASYPCTSGTLYDAISGICNWPSAVTCEVDDEYDDDEYYDDDDYTDDAEEEEQQTLKFCPGGYTGKAPTTECLGYVVCNDGEEGLSSKCPVDSLFNSMTLRCEYGFNDCQLLVDQEDGSNNLKEYAQYCQDQYTGKAPTKDCEGYVKCVDGEVTEAMNCPTGTKFDVMKLACTYANVNCGTTDEDGDMVQNSQQVSLSRYCPDEYTGRAPTKDCKGYVDCINGEVNFERECPVGTRYDVMVLACTFSEVQCSATIAVTYPPTPSPTEVEEEGKKKDKEDRPERIVVDATCPPGYTGNKAIDGCTGYIYCAAGSLLGKYKCTAGTIFDVATGYCNWPANVNIDVPQCATSSPSYMPTLSPMLPTASPSYTPTLFDINGQVFYPDYKNGVCRDDGNYPPSLPTMYLRSSAHGCCTSFFNDAYTRCMQAFTTEAPSMSPSGERIWYPDYDYNLCRSDLDYGDYEINFFASYERCCEFDFLDTNECLNKKPSALGLIYYPHYPSGTCRNDGRQASDEIWLYTSMNDCCKNDQVQPYSSCMGMDDEGNDMEQNSASAGGGSTTTTTTTTSPNESKDYYPDYNNKVCRNDGKPPEFEINFFSTYENCCKFSWIDTDECLANKPIPDSEKWYPVVGRSYCLNNGNPPSNVALADTAEDCCLRFFSSDKKCVTQSKKRWYPDFNETPGYCKNDGQEPPGIMMSETFKLCCDRFMSSNKMQCYNQAENFLINGPPPTKSPTSSKPVAAKTQKPTPTQKPIESITTTDPCQAFNTRKKCNNRSSCVWSEDESCITVTNQPTSVPTSSLTTRRPVVQSVTDQSNCQSRRNKRQCSQDDSCQWDDTFDTCKSAPTSSTCQSLKNKRRCAQEDSCSWNDILGICTSIYASDVTSSSPSSNPTMNPTPSPTRNPIKTRKPRPEPTPRPTMPPTHSPTKPNATPTCSSYRKKKLCTPHDSCRWDDESKVCITLSTIGTTDTPTFYPTRNPTTNNDNGGLAEMWFPIIAQSRCVMLPSNVPDKDPYATYVECCQNPWINDRDSCMEDAKTQLPSGSPPGGPKPFYPDYFQGGCKNDGKQSESEENLYDTIEECCNNEWLDYPRCKMLHEKDEGRGPDNNSNNKYYPDYFFNVCRNDGDAPPQETYLFDNIEDCCGLEYMEYEGCVYLSN